ncbi:hypothetical protein [Planctomycetes bacterium Pan216]|uniref:hypothetical protein n=1 Tax=Kolteria novifilia TaxID=2527975 RepID=UPI0011A69E2A
MSLAITARNGVDFSLSDVTGCWSAGEEIGGDLDCSEMGRCSEVRSACPREREHGTQDKTQEFSAEHSC